MLLEWSGSRRGYRRGVGWRRRIRPERQFQDETAAAIEEKHGRYHPFNAHHARNVSTPWQPDRFFRFFARFTISTLTSSGVATTLRPDPPATIAIARHRPDPEGTPLTFGAVKVTVTGHRGEVLAGVTRVCATVGCGARSSSMRTAAASN